MRRHNKLRVRPRQTQARNEVGECAAARFSRSAEDKGDGKGGAARRGLKEAKT
jgi:hypothetical protein